MRKIEISNGSRVGVVEWRGPGEIVLGVDDERERAFFERFFAQQDSFLTGPIDCPEMSLERRDATEEAFTRAAEELVGWHYDVRELSG